MDNLLNNFVKRGLITPPSFVPDGIQYLCIHGSHAYGTNNEESDFDIAGITIPPKTIIFPHLAGEIAGFGTSEERFELWEKAHIMNPDNKTEYDFQIYSIVRFFHLLLMNNPNIIGMLFVPKNCILKITEIGKLILENRKLFLHKGSFYRYKGYAYSQVSKLKSQRREGRRAPIVAKFGYDLDFAYNCVRLLNEIEQILLEGNLDLQRNKEQLKSIRRGEWLLEDVLDYFTKKESLLEKAYIDSQLPNYPDEEKIKALLLLCLEQHFGSLDNHVVTDSLYTKGLQEIKAILDRLGV